MYKVKINPVTGLPYEGRLQAYAPIYFVCNIATATQDELKHIYENKLCDWVEKVEKSEKVSK